MWRIFTFLLVLTAVDLKAKSHCFALIALTLSPVAMGTEKPGHARAPIQIAEYEVINLIKAHFILQAFVRATALSS